MLRLAQAREVTLRAPAPGGGGHAFAPEGRRACATVQPLRGDLARRMYGQEADDLRLMLCGLCADPRPGDGVCVDAAPDADPDFRVLYAARWPGHWEAHLKWIPPAQRGAEEVSQGIRSKECSPGYTQQRIFPREYIAKDVP